MQIRHNIKVVSTPAVMNMIYTLLGCSYLIPNTELSHFLGLINAFFYSDSAWQLTTIGHGFGMVVCFL